MPKHAITIPARRAGQRVRWMLEVTADVGEGTVHAKTSRKHAGAKRTKKPSRVRISRKAPMATAAVPAARVGSTPASATSHAPESASGTTASGMVVMVVVGAVVVGALALTAYPSRNDVSVTRNAQPRAVAQPAQVETAVVAEARPAPAAPIAATRVPQGNVEKPKQTPAPTTRSSPAAPFSWAAATSASRVSNETVVREQTTDSPAVAPPATSDDASQVVTVSGCLESTVDQDQFRLADTEGTDAPKARSWRSGFLKKRSAPVELVDLSDPVGLRPYIGRRVVATGVLSGKELRVRSLQGSSTACN